MEIADMYNDETFNYKTGKFEKMPEKMHKFLLGIKEVCEKHGLSISHEDGHGAFVIEEYKESNLYWLSGAHKNY